MSIHMVTWPEQVQYLEDEISYRDRIIKDKDLTINALGSALEAALKVIKAVNEAHLPGVQVPGFDGALEAVLQGDDVLKKAGQ